jgi:mono/diheme cytochrome c family protein
MSGTVRNLLLVLVLAGLIALHWAVLPDASQRNYEFLPDMVESVPRDAQAPVPALADGQALDLRPPDGSIARGYLPLGYAATPEEALRAGAELHSPFAADDVDALTRGEFIYTNFCTVCHGPSGAGDGPVTRRGVPPPPSLLMPHALEMRDGQMFHVISMGQGNMAAYASQVERLDRWKAIRYVRSLQAAPPADMAAAAAAEPHGAEEGL